MLIPNGQLEAPLLCMMSSFREICQCYIMNTSGN